MGVTSFQDLIGQRFGRLTVIRRCENKSGKTMWCCKCDCGKEKEKPVSSYDLKSGKVKSCGCLQKETKNWEKTVKHGMHGTTIYKIWHSMKCRCRDNPNYEHVKICDEWKEFEDFYAWVVSSGYKPGLTIDRINVYGNYEPSNCRWATPKQQSNNKRTNRLITIGEETHTAAEWADISGIGSATIRNRLNCGWPTEHILLKPNLANRVLRFQNKE